MCELFSSFSHLNAFACKFAGDVCVCKVCVCVQSKVSNNVSGRMCLAIEIYLHYYSVLTMRLGTLHLFPPFPFLPCTTLPSRSRWVARQLVKSCLSAKPAPKSSICRLTSVYNLRVFSLQSSVSGIAFKLSSWPRDSFEQAEHLQNVNLGCSASIQV